MHRQRYGTLLYTLGEKETKMYTTQNHDVHAGKKKIVKRIDENFGWHKDRVFWAPTTGNIRINQNTTWK